MALLLGSAAMLGCHKTAVQQKQPPDPLLITKKPVEGRPRPAENTSTVLNEPPAPPLPSRDSYPQTAQHDPGGPGKPFLASGEAGSDGRR
jgi:hypothetical protein